MAARAKAKKKSAKKKAASRTPATFPGYSRKGQTWLKQIEKNNNRDWFLANKATFEEEVKAPTEALVEALARKLEVFAPAYVPPDAKKAVMRVYRDVRFSKDKSPYKTNMSVKLGRAGGGPGDCAGFWFAVSGTGVDVVGGAYMPGGPQLKLLRTFLAENHKELEKLLKRKPLRDAMGELQGETLVRVPRGFDPEHVAGDLLRHKQFYLQTRLPAKVITTPDLQKELLRRFKLMLPFTEFLNEGLGAS